MRHGEFTFYSLKQLFETHLVLNNEKKTINLSSQEELLQLKSIEKSLAVFCLATYGEGDPTDNAMEFWDWIQGDVDLSGLNYAVSAGYTHVVFFQQLYKFGDLTHLLIIYVKTKQV